MTGGTGINPLNSNINECKLPTILKILKIAELEIEFGYCSEEESIFQSFSQDVDRILPKIKKTFSMKKDQKNTKMQFKDMIKRVSIQFSYSVMVIVYR